MWGVEVKLWGEEGVSQVQESAKDVSEDIGKRWNSLKDSASTLRSNSTTSIEEFTTENLQGDSKKEEKPSKGGLIDRIRGLIPSGR